MPAIYEIRCKKNSMAYVGQSEWIGARWGLHLSTLIAGTHRNYKMQKDFNRYGVSAFTFKILEFVQDVGDLDEAEIKWIGMYSKSKLYNIRLTKNSKDAHIRLDAFIKEIDDTWLSTDDSGIRLIYGDKTKKWFVMNAIKCNFLRIKNKEVTFIKVMKLLRDGYGYIVDYKRVCVDGKQRTCYLLRRLNVK